MKLKVDFRVPPQGVPLLAKTILIMKLTVVLLIAACLQVYANGNAQTVTLNENNVSFGQIFQSIQKQTGFNFFYKDELLQKAGKVSVNVKDVSIQDALDASTFGAFLFSILFILYSSA